MTKSALIKLSKITAGYKTITGFTSIFKKYQVVLRNIDLEIREGERLVVIGGSGSGKSTLLKVILGLLEPIEGDVYVYDTPIYRLPWRRRIEIIRTMGYVPQDPYRALDPQLTIGKILAEPLEALKLENSVIEERVRDVVKLVNLPDYVLGLRPDELSGGMRQRVLIARAIIHEPRILLLDEPTSALDVSIQAQIINLLNKIYSELGVTTITVTHDLAVAQYLADRVVILKNGIVVEDGLFDEVILNPRNEYTKQLLLGYNMKLNNELNSRFIHKYIY